MESGMPIKKIHSKTKNKCKVTFGFPGQSAKNVYMVGDFNGWDNNALPMKRGKTGFSTFVELDPDRDCQYRFLVDGERENDQAPDGLVAGPSPDCQSCVFTTRM